MANETTPAHRASLGANCLCLQGARQRELGNGPYEVVPTIPSDKLSAYSGDQCFIVSNQFVVAEKAARRIAAVIRMAAQEKGKTIRQSNIYISWPDQIALIRAAAALTKPFTHHDSSEFFHHLSIGKHGKQGCSADDVAKQRRRSKP